MIDSVGRQEEEQGGGKSAVVMITGASRGLGAALAEAFAAAGAAVSLCARNSESLQPVCRRISEAGGRCLTFAMDVRDEAAAEAWVERTRSEFGTPEVLINNASLLGPRVPLLDYPLDEWRAVLDVNLTGTLVMTRAVAGAMIANGGGSIINVSSGAALPPRRDWGAYAVSKDAVEGLSLNLAAELQGSGIRVNIVDPGSMRTEMRADAYPDEDPATVKRPESIAPLFRWLAGPESREVSGQRFRADDWIEQRV